MIIFNSQKKSTKLQTLQTKALKSIKYFRLKTSTQHIYTFFKTEQVKSKDASTARRFALSRLNHEQLANDYYSFKSSRNSNNTYKHKIIFETLKELIPEMQQINNIKKETYYKLINKISNLINTRTG